MKKKNWIIIGIGAALAVGAIIFFVARKNKSKDNEKPIEKEKTEQEKNSAIIPDSEKENAKKIQEELKKQTTVKTKQAPAKKLEKGAREEAGR